MAETLRETMNAIYRDMPLAQIPWNIEEPPRLLVAAVRNRAIAPCRMVDLGCGAGNYAVWLAEQGFEVTGLDISPVAVEHARALAERRNVRCDFEAVDLLGDLSAYHGSFDFACDWEVLHHIFPEDRERFVGNVHKLLRPEGIYLSVCFSEQDPSFGGEGKFRRTPIGTTLYFSSKAELRELFAPFFVILDLRTVEIAGKRGPHKANVAWVQKK